MKDQEYDDQLVEEMRPFFKSDTIDDSKKLCQFINQKIDPFIDSLKKKTLLEVFEKLDTITGNLPIFALGEGLSDEVRRNRLMYFAQETMEFIIPLFQIGIRFVFDYSNITINEKEKELIKLLGISNLVLLDAYVRVWETQYALFIEPVYSSLEKKNFVPKRQPSKGRQFLIDNLKDFFEKDDELKLLCPIMDFLDAHVRNSIVHLDYYIDEEENRLYYFNRRYYPDPLFIDMSVLGKIIIMLYFARIVICLLICRKMAYYLIYKINLSHIQIISIISKLLIRINIFEIHSKHSIHL